MAFKFEVINSISTNLKKENDMLKQKLANAKKPNKKIKKNTSVK